MTDSDMRSNDSGSDGNHSRKSHRPENKNKALDQSNGRKARKSITIDQKASQSGLRNTTTLSTIKRMNHVKDMEIVKE